MDFFTEMPYIIDVWKKSVRENPDKLWIYDGISPSGYTRRHADELSSRVYHYLKNKGIGREDFVMICLPRCAYVFIAMLGAWKAGAAVTIADEHYSNERIDFIYSDCNCKLKIGMDCFSEMLLEEPLEGYEMVEHRNAAYAVYTSGSTGNPKGVVQEFGKIKLDNISIRNDKRVDFDEDTLFALVSPLNFVAGIKTATYTIYYGSSLYIVPTDVVKNPIKLKNYLIMHKISSTFLSPSILRVAQEGFGPELKTIATGSESANGIFIEGVTLINNYGMSEAAFSVSQFVIDRPYDIAPIGVPNYKDIEIQLLDENGNQVEDGEKGEICFENPFFRGYVNLPEETAEALRGGVFHTGDIGVKLPDGNIAIAGRKNEMLKINGNRVEPAEIEAQAKKLFDLTWCCVKGFIDTKETILCLYYTDDVSLTLSFVREKLGEVLPYYMLPTHIMRIESIPLLQNNKVNKKALPRPETGKTSAPFVAPETETEKKLCMAFELAFEEGKVGIRDDFFELGGDSIHAMSVLSAADIPELDVMDIYSGGNIRTIARIVDEKISNSDRTPIEEKAERARQTPQKLTPTQTLFLDMQLFDVHKPAMYMSFFFESDDLKMADKLCEAANVVSKHRAIFSSLLEFHNSGYPQFRFVPGARKMIEIEDESEEKMQELIHAPAAVFSLREEPLYRLRLFRSNKKLYMMLQSCHISADGSLNQMILKDLLTVMEGGSLKADTGYLFLKKESDYYLSDLYMEHEQYYEEKFGGVNWCKSPAFDPSGSMRGLGLLPIELFYDQEVMDRFEKDNNISKANLMLLICMLSMAKISGEHDVQYIWTFSNRMDDISSNAGIGTMNLLPISLRLKDSDKIGDLFRLFRLEYDTSVKYHNYPWVANHCSGFENSAFVYESTDITDTSILEKMNFKPVRSTFFDPDGCAGFIQYQMVYERQGSFLINNIFNSSKIRRETMEELAKQQRIIFDLMISGKAGSVGELLSV